ncbi:MAG: proline--tRNA ligase [Candidatus Altiarchaeales archaeon]|nr:proline--tRNA ligase [Candidatus Altiarchaeales archaeon]
MASEEKVTFNIDKNRDFGGWYNEIVAKAGLADLRYNVKGFVVFMPWSVASMKVMYDLWEKELEKRGHLPALFPALIPESNFLVEKEHVEGFAPEVFWVTERGGGEKLEERLGLRPTSETAMYKMYSMWIRSYNDLPLKIYQSCQVWRHETKATKPFIRSREFHWIEAHDVFACREDAEKQVLEDMEITRICLLEQLGVPFLFFERPQWDKFAGADKTFAADCLMPDGKVLQLPSTHVLGQNFAKAFEVKYVDKDGSEKYGWQTCYGPAISRIFAGVISIHGDSKGLVFPFNVAPKQVVVIPINFDINPEVKKKAEELEKKLSGRFRVVVDFSDKRPGEKYYYWEMKGVPIRLEIGPKDLEKKSVVLVRRDTGEKSFVKEKDLTESVEKLGRDLTESLKKKALKDFNAKVVEAKSMQEMEKALSEGKIVRVNFCSLELGAVKCAEEVEKKLGARVRGKRVDLEEKPSGSCLFCGRKAGVVAYIARQY